MDTLTFIGQDNEKTIIPIPNVAYVQCKGKTVTVVLKEPKDAIVTFEYESLDAADKIKDIISDAICDSRDNCNTEYIIGKTDGESESAS